VVVQQQATTAGGGHRWLWVVDEEFLWSFGWSFERERERGVKSYFSR